MHKGNHNYAYSLVSQAKAENVLRQVDIFIIIKYKKKHSKKLQTKKDMHNHIDLLASKLTNIPEAENRNFPHEGWRIEFGIRKNASKGE